MRAAVNQGFPLNTVVSTTHFLSARRTAPDLFGDTVLACPAPDAGTALEAALLEHVDMGGRVLLYGPLRHSGKPIRDRLGVGLAHGLSGELTFSTRLVPDTLGQGAFPGRIRIPELLSGGGAEEVALGSAAGIRADVGNGKERRAFSALARSAAGGALGWVRGAFCETITGGQLPRQDDPREWFSAARLMRWILQDMGHVMRFMKPDVTTGDPVILASRHANGYFFSGFSRSTTVRLLWRLPLGVPVPVGCDVAVSGGLGEMTLPRAWRRECRVFVDQAASSEVTCREQHSGEIGITRRLLVRGLRDADVTFLADSSAGTRTVRFQKNDAYLGVGTPIACREIEKDVLQTSAVNGDLLISW